MPQVGKQIPPSHSPPVKEDQVNYPAIVFQKQKLAKDLVPFRGLELLDNCFSCWLPNSFSGNLYT
jgi:hypothetical protein